MQSSIEGESVFIKKRGFSLLEMTIAIFVFSLIILVSVSTFASIASVRNKTRGIQRNIETSGSAMELMAKTIRMSNLLSSDDSGFNKQEIHMYNNSQGKCISYRFSDGNLQMNDIPTPAKSEECSDGTLSYDDDDYADLARGVSGGFNIIKTDTGSNPPIIGRATILIVAGDQKIQTSVSFRDYLGIIIPESQP